MSQLSWQKSTFSTGDGENCVEVAADRAGTAYIRESDEPGAVVTSTPAAFAAFVRAVKAGEFDELTAR